MNAGDWAGTIFEHSWRASWLIVALAGLRFVAGRWIPAKFLFLGWLVVAVHLLVPVRISTPWSPYSFATAVLPVTALMAGGGPSAGSEGVQPSSTSEVFGEATSGADRGIRYQNGLMALWGFGVVVLVCARVVGGVRFRRRLRAGLGQRDERLHAEVGECARTLRLRRVPEVMVSSAVEAPAIFGVFRSTLLFPPRFSDTFSMPELRLMIVHELGHWRRRDVAANALLQAARILHWFNPFVWVATRLARQDCELACDEFVMRRASSAETHTYGATLLKVLGVVRGQNRSPQVLGILENKQQLKRRIQMIVNYRTSTVGRVVAGVALLAAVTFVAATREARAQDAGKNETAGAVAGSGEITTKAPAPWFKNGSKTDAYVVGSDPTQPHVKPVSAYIKSIQPEIDGFGGMMQSFSAEDYRGKRVRLSAWLKSENVKGTASVWMRVDGPNPGPNRSLQFDNMRGREVVGTTGWAKHSVVLDVPEEAQVIAMGFFVSGTGHVWVNDANFEVVGADVPSTNLKISVPETPTRQRARAPGNLDFAGSAEK